MPFKLNKLCELLYAPEEGSNWCSICSLQYNSFIRVTLDLISSRLLVGFPLIDMIISGQDATVRCMMLSL